MFMLWRPIADLPSNWKDLASYELPPLVTVWYEQADRLRQSGEFQSFNEKLRREIAIETGIIERLYTIDRGITRLLIEQGIKEALIPHGATDRPIRQVVSLIKDQEAAIEGLFDFVGGQRTLSTSYIKQLHQLLTQSQDSTEALDPLTEKIFRVSLIKGDWKRQPNNPLRSDGTVHEYCPPEQVSSEMDTLIELHHQHCDQKIPPEIESA
jgi:Fic family protein